jgi:hypothetical protein
VGELCTALSFPTWDRDMEDHYGGGGAQSRELTERGRDRQKGPAAQDSSNLPHTGVRSSLLFLVLVLPVAKRPGLI